MAKRREFAARVTSSTGCNNVTRATEGTGTSYRVCPEALRAGKCTSAVVFLNLAEEGQEHY